MRKYIRVSALLLLATACSEKKAPPASLPPVVQKVEATTTGSAPSSATRLDDSLARKSPGLAAATSPAGSSVVARITLKKSSLFQREFLYSATLQAASAKVDYSLAVLEGLLPARFRLAGGTLELVLDETYKYESDVNHPERLVQSFAVVAQDAETLTIEARAASPLAPTFVFESPKKRAVATSWIRSASASSDGQYLLFETAFETQEGNVVELMEAVFPREALIPAGTMPIYKDKDLSPLSSRFELLSGDPAWLNVLGKGRVQTKVASRYLVPEGRTIDWYILPNVPDDLLPVFQFAVEGWNRYSQRMWKRDLVRFRGRLPEGVKIGDPRYNVIRYNTDSEETTGWASEAADPLTGIISHAVINIPKGRILSASSSWQKTGYTQRPAPLPTPAFQAETEGPQGTLLHLSEKEFGLRYIRSTIMHEVGHTLGLAHNFKGSLTLDPRDPKSPISSSIMDYLNEEFRLLAFSGENSSDGPLFEYDRQAISFLYGGGQEILPGDPELPHCSDKSANADSGLIDPYCNRYDTGKEPSETLWLAIELLRNRDATLSNTVSLPLALEEAARSLKGKPLPEEPEQLIDEPRKILTYYLEQVLFRFMDSTKFLMSNLPNDPQAKRGKEALWGLHYILGLDQLDDNARAALGVYREAYLERWDASELAAKLSPEDRARERNQLATQLERDLDSMVKQKLASLRYETLSELQCREKASFYVGEGLDFEKEILGILEAALTGAKGPFKEPVPLENRGAAAFALFTCRKTLAGQETIERVLQSLKAEAKAVRSMSERGQIQALYNKLSTPPKEEEKP